MNREDYVNRLKSQVDQWNAEVAKWEVQAKQAQAGMQAEFQKQLEQVRGRRDEALAQLRKVQSASLDAWADMMRGTDAAFKAMQDAFNQARSRFDKK